MNDPGHVFGSVENTFDQRRMLKIAVPVILVFAVAMTLLLRILFASPVSISARSGPWSDPQTWASGTVPHSGASVTIGGSHDVLLDESATVSGLNVDGTLTFDQDKNLELRSNQNVVVRGQLVMIPSAVNFTHTLEFFDVDETAFVGGGLDVIDSDVGLWVMDDGQLYTKGDRKRGWTHAADGIPAGTTQFEVQEAFGWQVGDRISISPTRQISFEFEDLENTYNGFHEATITAVNGTTITIDKPTTKDHPKVNNMWTAEVMNLTRNVVIGSADYEHKAHIFIRSTKPQFIRFTEIARMGPGVVFDDGFQVRNQSLGRYGLHFHHSGNGSQGSVVEGTSMYEFGHHGYVPHESHGIKLYDTIAYDGGSTGYFWDTFDHSHDSLWEKTIAARLTTVEGGYLLNSGDNVEVRDSVAVGLIALGNSGGFKWENGGDGSWEFTNIIAHNIEGKGIRIWQNNQKNHILTNFSLYNIGSHGIQLGAYTNNYHFKDFNIYGYRGAGVRVLAVSRGVAGGEEAASVIFENGVIDGADASTGPNITLGHSAVPGFPDSPVRFRNITLKGRDAQTAEGAVVFEDNSNDKKIDMMNVVVEPGPSPAFFFRDNAGEISGDEGFDNRTWLRFQDADESFILRPQDQNVDSGATFVNEYNAWKKDIPRFRSDTWGDGNGLLTEVYDDFDMTELVYTGMDPYIQFEKEIEPHYHLLDDNNTAVRWRGQVMPQYSGSYDFIVVSEKARLTVDGRQIIDEWGSFENDEKRGSITLQEGRKYDVVLEIGQSHQPGSFSTFNVYFWWKQPGFPFTQFVPQSQLFLPEGVSGRPFVVNDVVVADEPQLPPYVGDNPDPDPEPDPDTTAPTVSIASPADGDTVSETVTLQAAATDNVGVDSVTFFVNGQDVGVDANPPFSVQWDSTAVTNDQYQVTATATDAAGNSASASAVTVSVDNADPEPDPDPDPDPDPQPDTEAPSAPGDLNGTTPAHDQVSLSWDAATDNVGVSQYAIYRNGAILALTTATDYDDTAVSAETDYTYTVRARDEAGNESSDSNQVSLTTPASPDTSAPSAPGDLTATVNQASVDLSWTASTDNRGVSEYLVQRDGVTLAIVTAVSYRDAQVAAGETYNYRVLAVDEAGNISEASNVVEASLPQDPDTTDTEEPTTPKNMRVRRSNYRKVVLRWKRAKDNVAISHYQVYRDGELIGTTTRRRFGDGTVERNQSYRYYVEAVDTSGNVSQPSETVTGTAAPSS